MLKIGAVILGSGGAAAGRGSGGTCPSWAVNVAPDEWRLHQLSRSFIKVPAKSDKDSMIMRPLIESDFEELCELYNDCARSIPLQPHVGLGQFRRQLRTDIWKEWPGYNADIPRAQYALDSEIALVALENDRPIAFINGSFVKTAGSYLNAGDALIRFVIAQPDHREAAQDLIDAVVSRFRSQRAGRILGLSYSHGPLFHNRGSALLSATWPWLGEHFVQAGFQPIVDRYTLSRELDHKTGYRLPIPAGLSVHANADAAMNGQEAIVFQLSDAGNNVAGECRCQFGSRFVQGSGDNLLYIEELFVAEHVRRRGVARFLLHESFALAARAGTATVTLRTEVDNFRALNLYRSEGFVMRDTLCYFTLAA